jgi:hypothetical protein
MSKSPVQSLARNAQSTDPLALEAMPNISVTEDVDPLADTNFTFDEKLERTIDVELSVEKLLSRSERRLRQLQRAEPSNGRRVPQRRMVVDNDTSVIDRIINWLAAKIKSFRDMLLGRFDKKPPPPVKFVTKTKEEIESEEREEREKEARIEKSMRGRGA